jgi:demethylmenaquinone methyltransferase / 2-methoxy-6-polyprenyl-1,4-benzoquinol methylase
MRPVNRATLEKDPAEVAAMFDGVARRYDLTNSLLTFGWDHRWRRCTRESLQLMPDETALDLAAGTGVSTVELARSGAVVVACDFSLGMLRAGRRKHPAIPMVAGDALRLPFADGSFDAATIAFGLRNVADVDHALRELARVVRAGGRLVVCEFSRPPSAPIRLLYQGIVLRGLPLAARPVSSNAGAYEYLAESIRHWPAQRDLARRIAAAGWSEVHWRDLTFGVVALHRAVRTGP